MRFGFAKEEIQGRGISSQVAEGGQLARGGISCGIDPFRKKQAPREPVATAIRASVGLAPSRFEDLRNLRKSWIKVWMVSDLVGSSGELPQAWLVIDWPEQRPQPYHIYTAWLDGPPDRIGLLRLSRQRFQIEQYFQRDKDDLGLDHFEGRSWRGFHHHLALAAVACHFILLVFLRAKKKLLPSRGRRFSERSGHC